MHSGGGIVPGRRARLHGRTVMDCNDFRAVPGWNQPKIVERMFLTSALPRPGDRRRRRPGPVTGNRRRVAPDAGNNGGTVASQGFRPTNGRHIENRLSSGIAKTAKNFVTITCLRTQAQIDTVMKNRYRALRETRENVPGIPGTFHDCNGCNYFFYKLPRAREIDRV